jgi:hypothetical protein
MYYARSSPGHSPQLIDYNLSIDKNPDAARVIISARVVNLRGGLVKSEIEKEHQRNAEKFFGDPKEFRVSIIELQIEDALEIKVSSVDGSKLWRREVHGTLGNSDGFNIRPALESIAAEMAES